LTVQSQPICATIATTFQVAKAAELLAKRYLRPSKPAPVILSVFQTQFYDHLLGFWDFLSNEMPSFANDVAARLEGLRPQLKCARGLTCV
jgi:hypothetical protein